MTGSKNLILASSSRYRRELLARLGLKFSYISPDVDETANPGELPADLAQRLAEAKARAVGRDFALVIGSDQVPTLHGSVLRKPGDRDTAIGQLLSCQGETVSFFTAVCLRDTTTGQIWHHTDRTDVQFETLSRSDIERYVDREKPFDSAGGFKAEGLGIVLFRAIHASDPTALIGLPLIAVARMLRDAGADPLSGSR
jgi:septum formation protein